MGDLRFGGRLFGFGLATDNGAALVALENQPAKGTSITIYSFVQIYFCHTNLFSLFVIFSGPPYLGVASGQN